MTATLPPAEPPTVIPGVYDIPAEQYHADPIPGGSLSSSGARKLLPPSCPAKFKYEQDQPQKPRREFDLGHAAHKLVLGIGPEIVVIDHDNYRTKDAREQQNEAHARDAVPLLRHEYETVKAMAAALCRHPAASALLRPDHGRPEQSLFWQDKRTGIWRRARLDWLRHPSTGRMVIPDYKTCASAAPDKVEKAIYDHGYHMQADWYRDAVQTLGLAGNDAAFVFIFQEKTPPYLINVVQPDPNAMQIGRIDNRAAIDLYAECRRTGVWPGYADDITLASLPPWVESRYSKELSW